MPGPLVMILGGEGKQQDFTPLAGAFRDKVRHAVLIGRDAGQLEQALRGVCRARAGRDAAAGGARRRRRRPPRRYGAALARMRQFRHVPRLRASRHGVRAGRAGAGRMSAHASLMGFARSSAKNGAVHLDSVTIALALGIVLLGLVMVTSASVSIAGQESGQPFYYLERQLLLTLIGAGCAALVFSVPTEMLERASLPLLALAIVLLLIVLVPGSRALRERQPPLAAPGRRELPGLRARPRPRADLHRQLRGAPRDAAARILRRPGEALGATLLRECVAAHRAGLRRGHGALRDRLWPAVPGRCALALRDRHDRARGGRLWSAWR